MSGAPVKIEPVRRSTLGGEVTQRLRALVVEGSFEPGTALSESELAARFGVSRGPIREALQHLVQEGLLRRDPRRGISVPVIGAEDLADLTFARNAIEVGALRIAVEHGHAKVELTDLARRMRAALSREDWSTLVDLDIEFHARLVAAAGSPRLDRMHAALSDETRASLNMAARHPSPPEHVGDHERLADLLERQDLAGILAILEAHLERAIAALRATDGGRPAPATARGGGGRR